MTTFDGPMFGFGRNAEQPVTVPLQRAKPIGLKATTWEKEAGYCMDPMCAPRLETMKWPREMEYKLVVRDPYVKEEYFRSAYDLSEYVRRARRRNGFQIDSLWMWEFTPVRLFDFGPHITAL